MASKAEERRNALRDRLITLAEQQIEQEGIQAIKARPLAQAAGCSVGAIYNVFGDLEDIIIAVNGRTFRKLGRFVAAALEGKETLPPTDRLIVMAHAYLDYAGAHPKLWRALFDLRMSADINVPDWYLEELARLFSHINGPVQECFPDMDQNEVDLLTRALFSSVHGIVLLGLENRISAVPRDQIRNMIALILRSATGNKKM
ncbi:TetR/AcrR family transcriptional regulator [uncultured Tateyamaria sp.]|uniref:TetR/AcrR family transcriptional regulator n=1 Tax=uncultured Tateyamaria sp. TaxID=455651 RepID=UPI0026266D65|nr:TetR/AcrR family transcriptional regulator [uncultured Tateyamaria sp.]